MCQAANLCQYVHLSCQIVHLLPICPLKFAYLKNFVYLCAKIDANENDSCNCRLRAGVGRIISDIYRQKMHKNRTFLLKNLPVSEKMINFAAIFSK